MRVYRPEIEEELARHGVRPRPTTSPGLVRDFVSHLYKYELRVLRRRLLRREFPRSAYAGLVVAVRRRYVVLSIPVETWTVEPDLERRRNGAAAAPGEGVPPPPARDR